MATPAPTLFFDYVDPASYVMYRTLRDVTGLPPLTWAGFELRVPPEPLIHPADVQWSDYQAKAADVAVGLSIPMRVPRLVPWTRKAHELAELARAGDCYDDAIGALFRAHFVDGQDIGRIDSLVEIAVALGLDRTEAKAALDVDHFTEAVSSNRALARQIGVVAVPTLVAGSRRLEGLRSATEVVAWVRGNE